METPPPSNLKKKAISDCLNYVLKYKRGGKESGGD